MSHASQKAILKFVTLIKCPTALHYRKTMLCKKSCGWPCRICGVVSLYASFVYVCSYCSQAFCLYHYQEHIALNNKFPSENGCCSVSEFSLQNKVLSVQESINVKKLMVHAKLTQIELCGIRLEKKSKLHSLLSPKSLESIKNLVIHSNMLDHSDINLLTSYLSKQTIQSINLNDNLLGDLGCKCLFNITKTCPHLIELQLEGNVIGNKGAIILSKCVEESTTLIVLNLCNNNIKDKGAMALKQCHHIRTVKVYLWSNKIAFSTLSLLKTNEGYVTFYV